MSLVDSMMTAMRGTSSAAQAADEMARNMVEEEGILGDLVSQLKAYNAKQAALDAAETVWSESVEDGRITSDEATRLRAAFEAAGMSKATAKLDEAMMDGEVSTEELEGIKTTQRDESKALRAQTDRGDIIAQASYHAGNITMFMRLSSEARKVDHDAQMTVIRNMIA
jgi:hypothetical protein